MSDDMLALLAEIANEVELEKLEQELVADIHIRKPRRNAGLIASVLLKQKNLDEAVKLNELLDNPRDIQNYPQDIRLKAERMWRMFGRDIYIDSYVNNGWFNFIGGKMEHIREFCGIFGINS